MTLCCIWSLDCLLDISSTQRCLVVFFETVVDLCDLFSDLLQMLPMPNTSISDNSFSILTPSLLWYLCCVLPICYTRLEKSHSLSTMAEDSTVMLSFLFPYFKKVWMDDLGCFLTNIQLIDKIPSNCSSLLVILIVFSTNRNLLSTIKSSSTLLLTRTVLDAFA